jgi:D-alanyl-lipoteichoic acid acyltransferase DltB (MBOAT superfamily)
LLYGITVHLLFNSYIFIFLFLPIVFVGFFRIGKFSRFLALLWLSTSSFFFYGWWDVRYLGLLFGSIVFNYLAGYLIGHGTSGREIQSRILVVLAITGNLILLGYYKYANFFAENFNHISGIPLTLTHIILPLGISFFTFTQIAFLVDTYQGKVKEFNFVHYALFVSYFPHLIAGPVLHHKEMMPQFAKRSVCRINWDNVAVGLSIFIFGLTKKLLIADSLGSIASPIFESVKAGGHPMLFEAWIGALGYSLQLYFDFSAYSDMAIGLSLMFNVRLPMNFNSPYKASSIIEFWRRWHMTLSRFLRDYLYIPLGGNRGGKVRRYFNLLVTMILGGLWHGAGWTFVIWGGLHGCYLLVNHAWRGFKQRMGWGNGGRFVVLGGSVLTFLVVVLGWVFFRADSIASAITILHGMVGTYGMLGRWTPVREGIKIIIPCLLCVFMFPNVRELFLQFRTTSEEMDTDIPSGRLISFLQWRPTKVFAWVSGTAFLFSVNELTHVSEFLYFQF